MAMLDMNTHKPKTTDDNERESLVVDMLKDAWRIYIDWAIVNMLATILSMHWA